MSKKAVRAKKTEVKDVVATPEVAQQKSEIVEQKAEVAKLATQVHSNTKYLVGFIIGLVIIGALLWFVSQSRMQDVSTDGLRERALRGESGPNFYAYNGIAFVQDPQTKFWQSYAYVPARQKSVNLETYFGPRELTHVPVTGNVSVLGEKTLIFLVLDNSLNSDPQGGSAGGIAAIEVGKILSPRYDMFNIVTYAAVSADTPNAEKYRVASCDNASQSIGVVVFSLSNQTSVSEENGCVLVQGQTPQDVIVAGTRLIFGLLGVMK
jgi:hypothetical protein